MRSTTTLHQSYNLKQLFAYNEELHRLRRENEALKDAVENSNKLREKSLSQVRNTRL